VFLLIVHVDDILILASEEEIEHLHGLAVDRFRWITTEREKVLSYLGMQIQVMDDGIWIDMENYINKLLTRFKDLKVYGTPAGEDLFNIENEEKEILMQWWQHVCTWQRGLDLS
jgi:hypothetical protein